MLLDVQVIKSVSGGKKGKKEQKKSKQFRPYSQNAGVIWKRIFRRTLIRQENAPQAGVFVYVWVEKILTDGASNSRKQWDLCDFPGLVFLKYKSKMIGVNEASVYSWAVLIIMRHIN